MRLSPRELDKLTVLHQAGLLAQRRLARGLRLNAIEVQALISTVVLEWIRDGQHSVAELMDHGRRVLGRIHVLPSTEPSLHEIQVEGTFLDGTKLVTIHQPISTESGDLASALYGSFIPLDEAKRNIEARISREQHPVQAPSFIVAGSLVPASDVPIVLNASRERCVLRVTNDGDRPIQVGSHYHFIETNPFLRFDRRLAYGKRLDIPAGASVRFEPGEMKVVTLVAIGGKKVISGGNALASGPVDPQRLDAIIEKLKLLKFRHEEQSSAQTAHQLLKAYEMTRIAYATAFGPTTGDRVRLGNSCLWITVEKDYAQYGDECVFGGGKVLREGMGQCTSTLSDGCLDLVITNALIVDYTGIYKADVGVKGGKIVAIGKAGNPDIMDNVTPGMVVGAATEALAGEGKILTAGGIDTHIHFICPQQIEEALNSGVTTMIGGGTGPNTGTNATTCTPGPNNIQFMLQSTDNFPLNFGFTGKGNCSDPEPLREQIRAGAIGLKLHEDWGTTPAAIDSCLQVCEEFDVQATIHTDTLNESGFVEQSIAAFKGRTIHAYHSEGAGGGHAPDIIKVCSVSNVIPSSTNPTRPFTVNTIDEHLDMLMVCHHLDKNIPEDIAFAESRIRAETMGAEDILHDLGAISIISSDSQAMGRIGEVICRTWQTASKMKEIRGTLLPNNQYANESEDANDNFRIRRYIAKYTINPAIAHGVSHLVGSVEVGKLADLVLWDPVYFGTKPETVLKGGQIVWNQMGDANASIPTTQPSYGRKMFAAEVPKIHNRGPIAFAFVSQHAFDSDVQGRYRLRKTIEPIQNCRKISKKDMKLNDTLPSIDVNPETFEIRLNGVPCSMVPTDHVCMAQDMFLF